MKPSTLPKLCVFTFAAGALLTQAAFALITIDTVPVGNAGNAADPTTGFGAVGYHYGIGKTEVTLNQYTTFLNAVAKTDTYGLYNTAMGSNPNIMGISRSGASGSYAYSVIGSGNRPVTYVSWFDAARFVNWMHNGQPAGAQAAGITETGAYTLNGATSGILGRNTGWIYGLPSENEWYKAAYHQPAEQGGDSDDYWLYPTANNAIPNSRNGSASDPNSANFFRDDGIANGFNGGYAVNNSSAYPAGNALTDVGAFSLADSFYGTFDQGGNVWEWIDAVDGSARALRGSVWHDSDDFFSMRASFRLGGYNPTIDDDSVGFRIVVTYLSQNPPVITLNGSAVVTNECHSTFTDPGATATGTPLAIAGGGFHNLALKSDGTVTAWGYNAYGQANVPVGLSNVVAIAGGWNHSLALRSDGTVAAWGYNSNGQTNNPVGLSNVVAIAGGGEHSLALKSDGTVAAWGAGTTVGEFPESGQSMVPAGLSNVVAIAGGVFHSLALKSDGTVVAWGWNDYGQTTLPVGLSSVVAIAGGGFHNLALKSDGTVTAWGSNLFGQTNVPVGLSNVVAITGGGHHNLVLKSDGTVVAWGHDGFGQTAPPVGLSNVVAIAGGGYHNLALKSDGTIVVWGDNSAGQTNVPAGLSISLPVTVSGSVDTNTPGSYLLTYTATNSLGGFATATRTVVVQDTLPPVITMLGANPLTLMLNVPFVDPGATALDACAGGVAVTTNSTVNIAFPGTYSVSYTATDSSGNSAMSNRVVRVVVPPVITLNGGAVVTNECHAAFTDPGATATGMPLAIAGGAFHSLALRSDGTVAAWGGNDYGQTNIPVDLSNVVTIAGGASHSLALKSDGTVAAWGFNNYGQTNIPVGLSNVVAIAGGGSHSLALKSDGAVVAWGYNVYGQTNIPVGLSNLVAIAGGTAHSLALKSDGTVAAWGRNVEGQTNIPVGLSNVVAIAGGDLHCLALKSDGTVAAWGWNLFGQTTVPVGLSNVVAIAGGGAHSLALQSDGAVTAWGLNNYGQTNPPVGLSNVAAIAGSGGHSLALKSDGMIVAWGYDVYGQTAIPVELSISLPVTVSGSVDTNTPGSYLLTYTATNILGGIATATRTVVVQDTLPPVITMLGANPLTLMLNVPFVDPGATALDACAGGVAVTTNSTVNIAFPGTYFVTYAATDSSGNSATSTRVVRVVVPPVITLNGDAGVTNECHAAFSDPGAMATGTPLAIAGGYQHSLVLRSDGTVAAWGGNIFGQTNIPMGLSDAVTIAGGSYHSLALKSDGTAVAWGHNTYGQTNIPVGLGNVVAIAGGDFHNLALKSDGTVAAWGRNNYGQTNIHVGLSNVVAIAGGANHSLALKSDGTVVAWGYNGNGETSIPVGLSNVVATAGGANHSLALKSDGTVVAWGYDGDGQTIIPVGLSNVVAIAGGGHYSLALKSDGTVVAWGSNSIGQTNIPAGLSNVVAIAGGANHSLGLKSDGTVVAWGFNFSGQTDVPAGLNISLPVAVSGSVDTNTPGSYPLTYTATNSLGGTGTVTRTVVVVDTLPPVISVLGANPLTHTMNVPFIDPGATALDDCAGGVEVATNSTVNIAEPGTYAVTYTATDGNGNSATNTRLVMVIDDSTTKPPIITLTGGAIVTNECHAAFTDPGVAATGAPLAIAAGYYHNLALKIDGSVAPWGRNSEGQTSLPMGLSNVVAIAGGGLHTLALTSDGAVVAWGDNVHGQTAIPVGLSNVVAIAGGAIHSLALRSDGTVAAWGYNGNGQTNTPEGLSNVVAIARGGEHNLALKSDGTVIAWGYNAYGQTNTPGGLSNVMAIAGGAEHSVALKSDGTIAAWGGNDWGQTNVPVGSGNVVAIAGGGWHSLVLQSNGTVIAWGRNDYGQTNIPEGLSNVVAIAGGAFHSLALKSDGTIIAWGDDAYGLANIPDGLSIALPVTVSGSVDTNTPGSYLLTYAATNILGGIAMTNRTVEVQDTLPPVITVLGSNPFTNLIHVPFVDPGATALDVCAGGVAVTTNSTVNIAAPGTYAVTYTATDGNGNAAASNRVVHVVAPPPGITSQPQNVSAGCGSGTATFSVLASGVEPLSYQWHFNGAVIPGAMTTSYTVNSTTPDTAGGYWVVVTNVHGAVTSSAALLTLTNQSPTVAGADTLSLNPGETLLISPLTLTGNDMPGVCDGVSTELTFLSFSPTSANGSTLASLPPGIPLWTNRYNGFGNINDIANDIAVDAAGNVIVTGEAYEGATLEDYVTIKYSSAGVALWTNYYNSLTGGSDSASAVAVDGVGNVLVTGRAAGEGFATVAYSSAGVALWTNRYFHTGSGWGGQDIQVSPGGMVLVTGTGFGDFVTLAYSADGMPLWTNRYDGPIGGNDEVQSVAVGSDGTVFVAGTSPGAGSEVDYATIAYSSAGAPLWTNRFNGPGNSYDSSRAVAVDTEGNVFATGASFNGSTYDFATVAYSSAGVPLWTNYFDGPASAADRAHALAVDADGNVFVAGSSEGIGTADDFALVAYTGTGVSLWTNRYDGPGNSFDSAEAVTVDRSGNVLVTGQSFGSGGSYDYATVAYSAAGAPLWTNRYAGPVDGIDQGAALAVDAHGNVFVTGNSEDETGWRDYATIAYSGSRIAYTSANGFSGVDTFTYVMRDSHGLMHTGTVSVAVGVVANAVSTGVLPGGEIQLGFYGMPGAPYALERTFDLSSGAWSPLQTNTAGANGAITFTNQPVGSVNFWRVRTAP